MSMTPFLALPTAIVHVIDEDSPLHGVTHAGLTNMKAEIVFILEGTIAVRHASAGAEAARRPCSVRLRPDLFFLTRAHNDRRWD